MPRDMPLQRVQALVGSGLTILGALVLAGRFLGIRALVTVTPGRVPMAFLTAVTFVIIGLVFLAEAIGQRRLATIAAVATSLIGAGVLGVYIIAAPLGLAGWQYDPGVLAQGVRFNGRMSPNTAVCVALLGLTLFQLCTGRQWPRRQVAASSLVMTIAFMALYGHVTGLRATYSWWPFTGMAVHSAAALFLAAAAAYWWTLRLLSPEKRATMLPVPFFTTTGGIVLVIGVTTYLANIERREAERRTIHSYEVVSSLNYAELCVTRMESAAWAFGLSHDEQFAAYYSDIKNRLRAERLQLRSLLAGDAVQSGSLGRFEEALVRKLRYMDQDLAEKRARRDPVIPEKDEERTGPNLMAEIRRLGNVMEERERARLRNLESEADRNTEQERRILIFGNAVALLFFYVAMRITRRAESGRAAAVIGLGKANRALEERTLELAQANRLQRAVLDGTRFSVIATTPEGTIEVFNAGAEQMLGYTAAEMIGRQTPAVIHLAAEVEARARELSAQLGREIAPGFEAFVAQARLGGADEREWTYVRKDGSRLPVLLSVTALRGAAGAVTGFMGIAQDIAERKRAVQALRDSEERFRTLAQLAPVGIFQTDAQGACLYVNERWSALAGLSAAEAAGEGWSAALHPDDREKIYAEWKAFSQGDREFALEYRFRHRDGRVTWVAGGAVALRAAAGSITGFLGTVSDITARKELETSLALARDQALESSRLKSEFLANMSHEIRTPMNGIIGMTGLLMDTELTGAQREMGQAIGSSAEHLLAIIDDILDFSKIEAGKLRIEARPLVLETLLDEVRSLLTARAQRKDLALRFELDARLPAPLLGDAGRIRQVLLNLIGNAIKFTVRGEIVVAVRWLSESDQKVCFRVEVRDTGIGIPAAVQPRLFQPFTQADGSTTRRFGGTGLGLAISRQLVELMGGEIGLSSELHRGSCFWFSLALPRAGEPVPATPGRTATGRSFALAQPGARLLVAEDNETNRLVARGILERLGFQLDFAGDGAEALQLLARHRYAAVLMDCQMPVMDGYTATRQIRAGAVPGLDRNITVIALTAYAMPSDRQKCLEAGMDDYLSKPLRPDQLLQALERCGLIVSGAAAAAPAPGEVLAADQVELLRGLPGRQQPTLWQEVTEIFLRETPADLATLRDHAERQDQTATNQLAHRLAGACGSLGGHALRQAAQAVEAAAARNDWAAMPQQIRKLDMEWRRLQDAILKSAPPPAA